MIGLFAVLPTLWGLWVSFRDVRYSWAVWRGQAPVSTLYGVDVLTLLLLANAALMLFVPFSTYREPLGILRFIVGLQIAVILYAAARRQRRALLYSTLWFTTILLIVVSDWANWVMLREAA
jgi:hypothetical protein